MQTLPPGNFFAVANIEPGIYQVLEYWCQVQNTSARITVKTTFSSRPEFTVSPGTVANLGVILWRFDYALDLSRYDATYAPVAGGDALVEQALERTHAGSPWLELPKQSVSLSGDTETVSIVFVSPALGLRMSSP